MDEKLIEITSKNNDNIKRVSKLKNKKFRALSKEYIADGYKLTFEAAMFNSANIKEIYISKSFFDSKENDIRNILDIIDKNNGEDFLKIFLIEDYIFESISNLKNGEGILAVLSFFDKKELNIDTFKDANIIPIFENISDPHNLGSVLRIASALGIKDIVITEGSADIYNEKVLRASMGAVFKVNAHIVKSLDNFYNEFSALNIELIGADMNGENLYDFSKRLAEEFKNSLNKSEITNNEKKDSKELNNYKVGVVFGNEANGLNESSMKIVKNYISIPMIKETESLNLSTATAIILYELYRASGFAF